MVCSKANVVVSTLDSSIQSSLEGITFETVIIDEVSQAIESSALIPLVHGVKRLILVGDQKQLDPPSEFTRLNDYNYYTSIYSRFLKGGFRNYFFLDTQFRMHPEISYFSNERFYHGRITDAVDDFERPIDPNVESQLYSHHINYINLEDSREAQQSTSFENDLEARSVVNVIRMLQDLKIEEKQIGVVTPYSAQVGAIRRELAKYNYNTTIKIESVDAFQGSEREYIIVSTVRSNDTHEIGFVSNWKRLNVTVTRAKTCLIVIGNEKTFISDTNWKAFIEYTRVVGSFQSLKGHIKYRRLNASLKPIDPKHYKTGLTSDSSSSEFISVSIYKDNSAYGDKEVLCPVSKTNVLLLWPDNEANRAFLKKWVDQRVAILNDSHLYVTLAYDSESVCAQFGDVFSNYFDIYKWKKGDEIPKINPNQGIIVLFYNEKDGQKNKSLLEIMKPLLEHLRLTLLTFDFTMELGTLYSSQIYPKTDHILDAQ